MADGILNPVNQLDDGNLDTIEQLEADFDFDVYTKQEVDALLDEKADKSDTYTKTETDNLLNGKADADSVYTKQEIDTKIPSSVGSATKPVYVNGSVITECTHELNKTVPANAVFTDTTYSAGNGLNLSGTSFSAKAGTNVTVDGSGINVNGSGVVASADSGLINGGTAYTELRPTLDGTWVKNAQTTATNLQKLEGGIEYLYGLLSHQYDQLKKYINGNYYDYDTDTDSKYVKTVPQGAMPYASLEQIGGRTLVWNQLFSITSASMNLGNGVTVTNNGDGSITLDGTATSRKNNFVLTTFPLANGHKYICFCNNAPANTYVYISYFSGSTWVANRTSAFTINNIETITTTATADTVRCNLDVRVDATYDNLTIFINFVDLTLLYGAGNEPTTVAEFQKMFPASYYSYNAGTLLSAGVTEVVSKKADTTTIATYSIPAEVQALEGYGWSVGSVYNYIDFERKVFVQNVGSVDLGTLTWGYGPSVGWSATLNAKNPADDDTVFNGISATLTPVTRNAQATAFSGGTDAGMVSVSGGKVYVGTGDIGIVPSGTLYYELDEPVETDISEYLTDDNLISVESGGTLTFPNSNGDDYRIDVPSSETFMVDLQEAI